MHSKIPNNTVIILPQIVVIALTACSVPFLSYLLINATINLANINAPTISSIDTWRLDINDINTNPASINKSHNFIFVSVNIKTNKNSTRTVNVFKSLINVSGKCSLILSIVLPCIVFIKYV